MTFRERVLEIIATAKTSILENLLAPIEEIGYFTFSNNNVLPPNEELPNSIFVFVACHKQDAIRDTLRWIDTRMLTAFICVRHTQRYRNTR